MKKSMIALSVMALLGSGAAMAASPNVKGGTSSLAGVAVGSSNHIMFSGGNSGVALNGAGSYIPESVLSSARTRSASPSA